MGAEAKADAVLITALDETAWLFNLRGGDVDYNPVFMSYGIITAKEAILFVDTQKVRLTMLSAMMPISMPSWSGFNLMLPFVTFGLRFQRRHTSQTWQDYERRHTCLSKHPSHRWVTGAVI